MNPLENSALKQHLKKTVGELRSRTHFVFDSYPHEKRAERAIALVCHNLATNITELTTAMRSLHDFKSFGYSYSFLVGEMYRCGYIQNPESIPVSPKVLFDAMAEMVKVNFEGILPVEVITSPRVKSETDINRIDIYLMARDHHNDVYVLVKFNHEDEPEWVKENLDDVIRR